MVYTTGYTVCKYFSPILQRYRTCLFAVFIVSLAMQRSFFFKLVQTHLCIYLLLFLYFSYQFYGVIDAACVNKTLLMCFWCLRIFIWNAEVFAAF